MDDGLSRISDEFSGMLFRKWAELLPGNPQLWNQGALAPTRDCHQICLDISGRHNLGFCVIVSDSLWKAGLSGQTVLSTMLVSFADAARETAEKIDKGFWVHAAGIPFLAQVQAPTAEAPPEGYLQIENWYRWGTGFLGIRILRCQQESELYHEIRQHRDLIQRLNSEIGERRKAEEALRDANRQIQRLFHQSEDSTRAKSTFLANMSHELRTPMNGIIGFSELLLREKLEDEHKEYVGIIRKSAADLLALLNDLLDLSKIEAQRMALERIAFQPTKLAAEVMEMLSSRADPTRIVLLLDEPEELGSVYGDPTRFRQILVNLVGNSLKYTSKGHVKVALVHLGTEADRMLLRLDVSDTGIGIEPHNLERIFHAFTQSDESMTRRFGGTGLGLAITRSLIDLMGGRIEVKSEAGQWTHFSVTLPLAKAETPPTMAQSWGKSTLGYCLLVDPTRESREILVALLEELGLAVFAVESFVAAQGLSTQMRFPLRIIDISLPDPTGVLEQWTAESERGILVGLVPHATPMEAWKQKLGCVLQRPVTRANLRSRLKEVLS